MASSTVKGLVPITKSVLSDYYDKHPCPPLSDAVDRLTAELRQYTARLKEEASLSIGEENLILEAEIPLSLKIDENLWKNREHIEEILYLLQDARWPEQLQQQITCKDFELESLIKKLRIKFQNTYNILESFQKENADRVFNTVMTYMPQDFRGTLIRKQRERSERKRQAVVDALINSGGSIHDRYSLLWKQQMDRRIQLAQLASASGIYKAFIKYLVGVPQVLLDFVQKINDDQGPLEEQRHRYGPSLRKLTKLVLSFHLFLLISWDHFNARRLQKAQIDVLEHAACIYSSEMEHFLNFLSEVFKNSPFLITAEEACSSEFRENNDYKETIVPVGQSFKVSKFVRGHCRSKKCEGLN